MRKIIHVDMDGYYAAIEQRDNPQLRGRPVVVSGPPDSRAVVTTASYEARVFGIHSAMPASRAARLCPQAVFVPPRFERYRAVSAQIQAIFRDYTERVEPLSLDEAYLEVTDNTGFRGSATLMARDIKRRIHRETRLTASAGVSYCKFLAKLASDLDKPDGLSVITPDKAQGFIDQLPIGRFHGIGPATEARMHRLGIRTGADLRRHSLEKLTEVFGKTGRFYHDMARGIDERPVEPHHERKSLGVEVTFQQDLISRQEVIAHLDTLAEELATLLGHKRLLTRTLTLKVKYADFTQITRSQTFCQPLARVEELKAALPALLLRTEAGVRPVRLLGLTASTLVSATLAAAAQLVLF
ncbi:MAG: DNA polymerase IV [Candidatus Competibacteraceae bacterium]|nr:DNA polymerase IV [Candidatus Competibacteraceae bacterium]